MTKIDDVPKEAIFAISECPGMTNGQFATMDKQNAIFANRIEAPSIISMEKGIVDMQVDCSRKTPNHRDEMLS